MTSPAERVESSRPTLDDPLRGADVADERVSLPAGLLLQGRYEVERLLGDGGHGSVYRGRQIALDLAVAIKVVRIDGNHRGDAVARFVREARTVAQVKHRNVLSVYDAGKLDDGSPYLVTELIEGQDLEQRLQQGPLSIPAVVDLGRQLFSALAALGELGIVHRDVKPANLMLRREVDGQVHATLIDFGIARPADASGRLTQTGAVVGTPHYMSPEHLVGEVELDARSDLYAASVVLYEALTGQLPFDGENGPVVVGRILMGKYAPLAELCPACPAALADLIERGLARDRDERPGHALEVLVELDAIARGLPTGAEAWAGDGIGETTGAATRRTPPARRPSPTAPLPLERRRASQPPASRWRIALPWIVALGLAVPAGIAVAERTGLGAPEAAELTPAEHADAGLQALARGEIEVALEHYRTAAETSPTFAEAFRGRGLAAARAGRLDEAIRSLERYLALAPDAPDAERIGRRARELRASRRER